MEVPPEVVGGVGFVVVGLVGAVGKLYADLKATQKECRDEAKEHSTSLVAAHQMAHEYIDKMETLFEAKRRGGLR